MTAGTPGAPDTLRMLDVRSGRLIGRVSFGGDGGLNFEPPALRADVEMMAVVRERSPREAFDRLNGWTNGYVRFMPEMRLARVFDGVGEDGAPYFAPGHPVVDDPAEREGLAAYLEAGTPILSTTGLDADRVRPERGTVVPLSFRTDGAWIWTDTVAYYLRVHGIRPDPDLCAHIDAAGRRCPPVNEAVARHALDELRRLSAA
ncbi:hypothetical protein AB0D67_22820 [Streptosporangium sp. NPDC048047]|uniref:hypothetical protein n=1 Tax=Streptosporangium sp. NPDC048047 TaxID=3155748 RepID=UPI0034377E1C